MEKFGKHIHFLGIGGISQSALAQIFFSLGFKVTGSDIKNSHIIDNLVSIGIEIDINTISNHIKSADTIVFTSAIKENDQELCLAKQLNKQILTRSQALGELASSYQHVISVAGSHGKTTTTGMIAKIFVEAKLDPTVHIGGELDFINGNVRVGGKGFFITEACEYYDSFLSLKSDVSVILNIQKDHLDYFKNINNIKKSFKKFAANTKNEGIVIYSGDDLNIKQINKKNISFSLNNNGILVAKNIQEYKKGRFAFDVYFLGVKLFRIKLSVYGKHNIANALAAISVALYYGIDLKIIKKALIEFTGASRRFQIYGNVKGIKVIHDYAHHPTEIKASIEIAKKITKGKLFVCFQPHTYSRTLSLIGEFKKCFNQADELLIYKVYSAREKEYQGLNHLDLAKNVIKYNQNVYTFEDYKTMKKHLLSKAIKDDLILVLGAGDIENFANFICRQKD